MAEKYNLNYMEVSAKTNINVEEVFYMLGKLIKSQIDTENKS